MIVPIQNYSIQSNRKPPYTVANQKDYNEFSYYHKTPLIIKLKIIYMLSRTL
jgi:hypothetical protein